jgi:hypothetical protein
MNTYGDPNHEWRNVIFLETYIFALLSKKGKLSNAEPNSIYLCEKTGMIMSRFTKAHFAEGRILKLMSNIPGISSGEYIIQEKEGFNYGFSDTLRLKRYIPVLDTARKANNWAEKQIRYQEAMESLTSEERIAKMMVL